MRKRSIYIFSAFLSMQAYAYGESATGDFWKDCPGPGCPANVPENPIEGGAVYERDYEKMDKDELRIERDRHEKAIDAIDRAQEKYDMR